jgi:hypothetical protein
MGKLTELVEETLAEAEQLVEKKKKHPTKPDKDNYYYSIIKRGNKEVVYAKGPLDYVKKASINYGIDMVDIVPAKERPDLDMWS